MSGRRTYALYKISHKDGAIMWRLGGKKSDFTWIGDGHFSGQHDARFLSQNETHMIISIMDNATGPGKPSKTNDFSRGLLIALRTDVMTAEVIRQYNHPHLGYAEGRGNFQTLSNSNAFLCWTNSALQSEHLPNGELIMEAKLTSGLKSYRSYKFKWVGKPTNPPDVHSAAIKVAREMHTIVHVSWNGATQVASWNLYKSNAKGEAMELVASTPRRGFETAIVYKGYASHVMVEAVDHNGSNLGASRLVNTIAPADKLHPAVVQEAEWLQDNSEGIAGSYGPEDSNSLLADVDGVFGNPIVTFFCGILFCLAAGSTVWLVLVARRKGAFPWWRKTPLYSVLWEGDQHEEDASPPEDRKRSCSVVSACEAEYRSKPAG